MNKHRHELQTNELATYLQKLNRSIEPYSKQIAVVLGLLIVGGIAWGLYSSKVSGDRSDATLQLIQAVGSSSAEQLATVSEAYPETAAAAWSRLYEGNAHLADGLRALYVDRDDAKVRLDDARAAFEAALLGADDRLLRSRAHFGLARVAESLGEVDEAIAAFRQCIEVNESEAMVKHAQNRIDALSDPETKDFIAWFSKQDFRPADPSLPPSLPSEKTLPDLPDLDLEPLGETIGDKLGVNQDDGGESGDKMKLEDKEGLELPDDADLNTKQPSETAESTDAEKTAEPAEQTDAADAAEATDKNDTQPAPAETSDAEKE